jgi:hypothetical protein
MSGLTEKQIIAQYRMVRLDIWLAKQPLNPKWNSILEASIVFRNRLKKWADSSDPHLIAPSFQYQTL